MNIRDFGWVLPGIGATLRRVGGYQWKWAWRYLGPVVVAGMGMAYGIKWWRALLCAVLMGLVASLGIEGSWAHDWRIFIMAGQGLMAGLALWPLRLRVSRKGWKIRPEWPSAGLWLAAAACAVSNAGLFWIINVFGLPHGIYEAGWGFCWYSAAAWLIVQEK